MKNAQGSSSPRGLSSGAIIRSRYVICCLTLGDGKVVDDFYAYTYKQARYRFARQVSLLSDVELVLLPFSELKGWMGDAFGDPVIRSGQACVEFKNLNSDAQLITGADTFLESGAAHGHKFDLTLVSGKSGCFVAYDGVLWSKDESAESLLAQVGREIDTMVGTKG